MGVRRREIIAWAGALLLIAGLVQAVWYSIGVVEPGGDLDLTINQDGLNVILETGHVRSFHLTDHASANGQFITGVRRGLKTGDALAWGQLIGFGCDSCSVSGIFPGLMYWRTRPRVLLRPEIESFAAAGECHIHQVVSVTPLDPNAGAAVTVQNGLMDTLSDVGSGTLYSWSFVPALALNAWVMNQNAVAIEACALQPIPWADVLYAVSVYPPLS